MASRNIIRFFCMIDVDVRDPDWDEGAVLADLPSHIQNACDKHEAALLSEFVKHGLGNPYHVVSVDGVPSATIRE